VFKIDIMQEMEQERLARESEEKERAERMKKIKEQYTDPNSQWEKDKADIQSMAMQEKTKEQPAAGEDTKASSSGSSDQVREAAAAENAGR
jgi:mannan polymerase II complex ANP1 subunit